MTTPLQQAAQALIEQHLPTYLDQHIAELRKALDAELAQSVEPYAVFHGLVDSGEHGAFNLDLLKMIPRGAYLYLHPPQQVAVTSGERAELIQWLRRAHEVFGNKNSKTIADMLEADAQQAKQVPMTDNEIARIAQLTQSAEPGNDGYILPFTFARAIEAHHGITPADKPTGWDNGLSQDYCAEFGQWLASRPGARQQIKAMFDTSTPLQP